MTKYLGPGAPNYGRRPGRLSSPSSLGGWHCGHGKTRSLCCERVFPFGSLPWPVAWHCAPSPETARSEEHTSELQSRGHLVCRLLLEKKNNKELLPHD